METTGKRRGRPRTHRQPQSWVSTKIAETDHDRLIRLAANKRASVAAIVRWAIQAVLEHAQGA